MKYRNRKEGTIIESFEKVYDEVFPILFRIVYHITNDTAASEDLCQEAFIRYYNRAIPLPSLDQSKYWLIRVVKNLSFNYIKRKGREHSAYLKVHMEQKKETAESGETELIKKETRVIVQEALKKLPLKLRSVLIFREYGGLSYKEIGKILKITEGNVKVRVFRAREHLNKIIKEGEVYVS